MMTNELRKLVKQKLDTVAGFSAVYYERADPAALYPHATFSFDRVDESDLSRHDYRISIDVWDRSESDSLAEELTDAVEVLFNAENCPADRILPTFFLDSRRTVVDEDKLIRHKQIELIAQNYNR